MCHAQLGISDLNGPQGNTVINFKNGSSEEGIFKGSGILFGYRYEDPYEFKFKSKGEREYRTISSNQVKSIVIYDSKDKQSFVEYFPIRIRDFGKKYTFSDKYHVDFYPLSSYKGIPFARIVIYFGANSYTFQNHMVDHYYFPVGKTGYYFLFDGGFRRSNKESAQFMMLLDKNCEAFQAYMQENYLDTDNYKADYEAAVKAFKKTKSEFVAERKARGYSSKGAKIEYKSAEFFIYFKQILDKYSELCTHENHD
nr:hypothetical protein [Myroides sp. WP-1]